ncbi:FAD NAD(P)-binding domain-containing [Fusarium acutatum]|uniref:FAD NAD(P)-binding domain-containing n=1 Tax=Fusarium acutatum TaxID=78861 RepID=A0A8H4JB38_9HYPO|nr:FAD NAD(P)-binding domain-containing [Fusarium acutatum]
MESLPALDTRPRATHYGAPAVHEFQRAGVLEEIREQGFIPQSVEWRKPDGTLLASLDRSVLEDIDSVHCLPLDRLGPLLLRRVTQYPTAKVSWNHKVISVGQDATKAWVKAETEAGLKLFEASYVVFYPFDKYGYGDTNYIISPENWHMAAKISRDGLWRVTYGEKTGLSAQEILDRQPAKFEKILPSHPNRDDKESYKLMSISPYRVHQRRAHSMRVGRICLAADAAHSE